VIYDPPRDGIAIYACPIWVNDRRSCCLRF
jgi:hypothetical protein